ncbi:MAG: TetR/AcrR family transcriptional regulator [Chitinophagaceae bacterium]
MEIRDRIKQKAEELFRKYGIRSITMDEIATQLGISKKTIYQSYADKDELVEAVIGHIISHNQGSCSRDSKLAKNAIHEVFLIMEMMKEIFESLNPSIFYDLERNHPKAYLQFLQHKHEFILKNIRENLRRGINEGYYRSELDVDVVSKVRLETMMMSFNQDIFPRNKVNIVVVEQQIIEHFLFGIANLKGHRLIIKYQQERIKIDKQDGTKQD